MRDLAFFRREKTGGKRELQIVAGAPERDFVFLRGWDGRFARGTEQDTRFQFLHDLINPAVISAKTTS